MIRRCPQRLDEHRDQPQPLRTQERSATENVLASAIISNRREAPGRLSLLLQRLAMAPKSKRDVAERRLRGVTARVRREMREIGVQL